MTDEQKMMPCPVEITDAMADAWVIPGIDNARDSGWLDAMAWQEGEFSKPLFSRSTIQSALTAWSKRLPPEGGEAADLIASLNAEVEGLRKAVTFYRDGWDFKTHKKRSGLEWFPKEELLDDCGNIARAALSARGAK